MICQRVSQGDVETLFQVFLNVVPNNIIAFAADTINVMFGEHNSGASRLKKKIPNIYVLVTLLIYVHHMPVKSFPEQLRNYRVMCTTIFAIVPNIKKCLEQFSSLLLQSLTNCFTLAKHVGFPSTLMYQGLLSNGMHWMIFCMLPLQTLTLTQISYDFISNCCTLL